MFEPIRGGTRGGQAEFKWSDVSADKDREVRQLSHVVFAVGNRQSRTIWATVSMPQLEGGRRTRISTGITETKGLMLRETKK